MFYGAVRRAFEAAENVARVILTDNRLTARPALIYFSILSLKLSPSFVIACVHTHVRISPACVCPIAYLRNLKFPSVG